MRLTEAIKMGNTRKAEYFQGRLEQMTQSEPKRFLRGLMKVVG